jgi:hypothetical protein
MAEEEALQVIPLASGCPSSQIKSFHEVGPHAAAREAAVEGRADSALTHWPVQVRLVPPSAPFLKDAHLLIVADCVPVAYPNFHQDFLKGKVVMVGCPKFDDAQSYIQKFAEIFKGADIKSVTALVMDVPCCQGLPIIVEKGMEKSGKKIPMEKVVISAKGEVLGRERLTA